MSQANGKRHRVLLVTPVEQGSGETITSLHVAQGLVSRGHEVRFLAAPFAARFLEPHFPDRIDRLGFDERENRRLWDRHLARYRPDTVVFADYPLLFFPSGVVPLASPEWINGLDSIDAELVTLDHFGFAQEAMGLFFGPPHLSFHYQTFPATPERMRILLPCPMHEPGTVEGRRGTPFRYWDVPIRPPRAARDEIRAAHLDRPGELLIFHSVPNWAWRLADTLALPLYRHLPDILAHYLGDLGRPVKIVSVNNGRLLRPVESGSVRITNLDVLPKDAFEGLLFGSDLVLTENSVSISMGKALCGDRTAAALVNSYRLLELTERLEGPLREKVLAMERQRLGSVYPFRVFPTGMTEELERIVLYRDNSLTECFASLEIFGGEPTREALRRLLLEPPAGSELEAARRRYVERVAALPECAEVLERLTTGG